MTENGIYEMEKRKKKSTVMALIQTPGISIKYYITVKAKRDRAEWSGQTDGNRKRINRKSFMATVLL